MGEPHFREGQLVEVTCSSSEGDGEFKEDAWFVATVIDLPSESNGTNGEFFLVEYQSIIIEDDEHGGSKPLREYVHASFTRPLPPSDDIILDFQLNEHIDAFYKHGWREGVITRVSEDSRYGVCLRCSGEELEFQNSNLRVHLEWIDGRWISPEELQQREFDKTFGKLSTPTVPPIDSPIDYLQMGNNTLPLYSSSMGGLKDIGAVSVGLRGSFQSLTNTTRTCPQCGLVCNSGSNSCMLQISSCSLD